MSKQQPKQDTGISVKARTTHIADYPADSKVAPVTYGSKTHLILSIQVKGATVPQVRTALQDYDKATGKGKAPNNDAYARTWFAKSYVNTVYGYGMSFDHGKDNLLCGKLVMPKGQSAVTTKADDRKVDDKVRAVFKKHGVALS